MRKIPAGLQKLAVDIETIKPHPENARQGNVPVLQESLRAHGQLKPLIVQRSTGYILAGNHTWRAAAEEGWKKIAVLKLDVGDDQARRILLIDNRAGDLGDYDDDALLKLLQDVGDLEGTGWGQGDMNDLMDAIERDKPSQQDPDDAPEPPAKPQTEPGDLYTLGRHRLICGDAKDWTVYDRLMTADNGGEDRADLLLTDPPYGVEVVEKMAAQGTARDFEVMAGDEIDGEALRELWTESLSNALAVTKGGSPAYVCHSDVGGTIARESFTNAGWRLAQVLIWVKDRLVLGRQDYQWRHEPILYGWNPAEGHRWYGDFDKTTVIEQREGWLEGLTEEQLRELVGKLLEGEPGTVLNFDRPARSDLHPTMKPVTLFARLMLNSTRRGDQVLDPFGGSGTTLITCDMHERECRMVEQDPRYCDVIIERWEQRSGGKAKRARRH